jgi:hypothetical protein
MSLIEKLLLWLDSIFNGHKVDGRSNTQQPHLPPINFECISAVERPPNNSHIEKNNFYLVTANHADKWALFQCPCGCGHIITLSLQFTHNHYWRVIRNISKRPTLYPSVWQNTPCLSHFWLKDGRVYWCPDSGTQPGI